MATLQETVRKDVPVKASKQVKDKVGQIINGKVTLPEDTLTIIKYAYQLGVKDGKTELLKSQGQENTQMATITQADMANLQKRVAQLKESVDQEARTFTPIQKMGQDELLTVIFDQENRSQDERNLAADVLLAKLDNNYSRFTELIKKGI